MFGNFGSLLEGQTGAGMGGGGSVDSSVGSAGSESSGSSSSGSSGSSSSDLGSGDSLASSRENPLIRELETGTLGNGLTQSLDTVGGSLYNMPPWYEGSEGIVPVLSGPTQFLQLVTGPTSPNETIENFAISGTDLGIMWDNGSATDPEVLVAFGDTMGDCTLPGTQWRSNVLLRSDDTDLDSGMGFTGASQVVDGVAQSIVPRSGLPGEVTIIPTAGVAVNGVQYLRFMSVAHWGIPSTWDTNYSGMAYSTDGGANWEVMPHMARPLTDTVPVGDGAPDTNPEWAQAQMSSFVHGEDDDYLYEYLTPSGRQGAAVLARVPVGDSPDADELEENPDALSGVTDPDAYEYYDGDAWVDDISAAEAVLPRQVSELSVAYNDYLGKYVSMYTSGLVPLLIRTADSPEGPWSDPTTLIGTTVLPGAYGGYMHPWGHDSRYLYYLVTTWNSYNVFLVRTDLEEIGAAPRGMVDISGAGPSEVVRQVPVSELPPDGMVPTE